MATFAIRVAGLEDVQRKLRAEHLYAEPLREALREAGELVKREAEGGAPVDTGRLKSRIRLTVSKAKVPKAAFVRLNVTKRGFRYPWALNTSRKRVYRFRSGPRRGSPTRGWFTAARDKTSPHVNAILARAARQIERQWQT